MADNNKYAKESYEMPNRSINSSFWKTHFATDLYERYKLYIRGDIIDFGCNFGWWLACVSRFEEVNRAVGYDINEESIRYANNFILSEIPDTRHKVEYKTCNLLDIPEKERTNAMQDLRHKNRSNLHCLRRAIFTGTFTTIKRSP